MALEALVNKQVDLQGVLIICILLRKKELQSQINTAL
jgi:hypothetical protein